MTDVMNIQRVLTPIFPGQKVRRLKKQLTGSQKRRFERDLEDEKDGGKNEGDGSPSLEMTKATNEKGKREERNFGNGSPDLGDMKKGNVHGTIGALLDIRL